MNRHLLPLVCVLAAAFAWPAAAQSPDPRLESAWRLAFQVDRQLQAGDLAAAGRTIADALAICATLDRQAPYCLVPARLREGRLVAARGDHAQAERVLRDTIAIADAAYPAQSLFHVQLRLHLGRAIAAQGRSAEAEAVYRAAAPYADAIADRYPLEKINVLNHLGVLLRGQGRVAEAEQPLREALATAETAGQVGADSRERTLRNLAQILIDLNRPAEAEVLLSRAIAERQARLGQDDPSSALYVALRGRALFDLGRRDEAVTEAERALRLQRRAHPAPHVAIAVELNQLGMMRVEAGQYDEAERLFAEALAMREALGLGSAPATAALLANMARLRQEQRRPAAALPLLRRALAIQEARLPAGNRQLAQTMIALGLVLRDLGQREEAAVVAERACGAGASSLPGSEASLLQVTCLLLQGELERLAGRPRVAVDRLERGLVLLETQGRRDRWTAALLRSLGQSRMDLGDAAGAVQAIDSALAFESSADTVFLHAQTLVLANRLAEAATAFDRAQRLHDAEGRDPLAQARLLASRAALADRQGRRGDADALLAQAAAAAEARRAVADPYALAQVLRGVARYGLETLRLRFAQELGDRLVATAGPADLSGCFEALSIQARARMLLGDAVGAREAAGLLQSALATLQASLPSGAPALERTKLQLGLLLLEQGRVAQAEPLLRGAHAAIVAARGADTLPAAAAILALSDLALVKGDVSEAAALTERALRACDRSEACAGTPAGAAVLLELALARAHERRAAEAADLIRRAEAMLPEGLADQRIARDVLRAKAIVATMMRDYDAADALLLRYFRMIGPERGPALAIGLNARGLVRLG